MELFPGGAHVAVTDTNRFRYIHLAAHYYLNGQMQAQSAAFLAGLRSVIDMRWLRMFNEAELQVLLSGSPQALDVDELKAATHYTGGYYALDRRIQWLWQVRSPKRITTVSLLLLCGSTYIYIARYQMTTYHIGWVCQAMPF
jgi:ubiquitin-protein ligase E3 C